MTGGANGRARMLLPLALGLLLLVPSLFTRDVWDPDESRYAEVSREMLVRGDFLVPHLNGEVYTEKPPLFFWLSAALQFLGCGPHSGRLVVAAAAIGLFYLTVFLARLWLSPPAAVGSALILGSVLVLQALSKVGVLDVPLVCCTTLAVYGLFRHDRDGGRWIVLFYVGMALATLTKGPVGILVPALAAVALATTGGRPVRSFRHAWWGVPLILAIVLSWLVLATLRAGPDYLQAVLVKQTVNRAVASWSYARPWHYYLWNLPLDYLPWTALLPGALIWHWKRRKSGDDPTATRLMTWVALGLVALSLISSKRERYMLPFYPPLAILIAGWLDGVRGTVASRRSGRGLTGSLGAAHGIAAIFPLGLLAGVLLWPRIEARLQGDARAARLAMQELLSGPGATVLILMALCMLGMAAWGCRLAAKHKFPAAAGMLAAQTLVFSLTLDLTIIPPVNRLKSPRRVARAFEDLLPPGDERAAMFPNELSGVFNLYTGRTHFPVLTTAEEVGKYLAQHPENIVLTTARHYRDSLARIEVPYEVVDIGAFGDRPMVIIRSRSASGAPSGPTRGGPAPAPTAGP